MIISYKSQHRCRLHPNLKIIPVSKMPLLSNTSLITKANSKIPCSLTSLIPNKINSFTPPATPSLSIYSAPPSKTKKLSSLSIASQAQRESYVSLKAQTKGTLHGVKKLKITLSFSSSIYITAMEACIRKKLLPLLTSRAPSIFLWLSMAIKFLTLNSW